MKPRKTRKEIARVNKIAEKLNKVMSNREVVTIIKRKETYTVFFKNGQKFIFTPYFPHRFHNNKIIPIHEGESYVSEVQAKTVHKCKKENDMRKVNKRHTNKIINAVKQQL